MKIKSTKAWHKMPCAHAQFQDVSPDGSPGECASWHGYDRSVVATFAGDIDEYGWVVPFGELRKVRDFIEYYLDHTAVIPANDPRLSDIVEFNQKMVESGHPGIFKLRVMPYGVSMEMTSLFLWEHINAYIYAVTEGRCYVEKIECIEHDSNSAWIEVSEDQAILQATESTRFYSEDMDPAVLLPKQSTWGYVDPRSVI